MMNESEKAKKRAEFLARDLSWKRKPFVAGNWKMNQTLEEARSLVATIRTLCSRRDTRALGIDGVQVAICPPATLMYPMLMAVSNSPILLGAQNTHATASGEFTGGISAPMFADTGCTHVIVGHSEVRDNGNEEGQLAAKVRAVVNAGLTAIFCITGGTLPFDDITLAIEDDVDADKLIIAYQPLCSILPEMAQEIHARIRKQLASIYGRSTADEICIIYGGNVHPENAAALGSQPDIDGVLVGKASLVAEDFVGVINEFASVTTGLKPWVS